MDVATFATFTTNKITTFTKVKDTKVKLQGRFRGGGVFKQIKTNSGQ